MPEATATEQSPAPAEAPNPTTTPAADATPVSWLDALDLAIEGAEKPADEKPAEEKPADEKPADEKPTEEKPVAEEDADTRNMTPKAGEAFKAIKSEAKAAKARVAELEAKLAEVEKAPKPDVVEAEALKAAIAEKEAKIKEYESELAISRFEATPEYKESVVQPLAAILGVVERLSKKYSVSEKVLLNILEEGDPDAQGDQISETASAFSERDRVSLYSLADDYSAVISHREELRAKASAALAAREKTQAAEATARTAAEQKAWKEATSKVWDSLKAKIPLPEDAAERAKIESDITAQVAGTDFATLTPELKAFAAYSGALVPVVVKQNVSLKAEVAELKEALKKYQTATPGAGAGTDTTPQAIDAGVSFLDAIDKHFS